jgi:uncharacterized protein
MQMHWDDLTFLHWPYDPDVIQSLLPKGLTVDTYQENGWISLVPFVMRVIVPGDRVRLPFIGRFPETNVRTYVRATDGTQGIWFFSLDAGSALATLGGRAGYRLPYMWSNMTVDRNADTIEYCCSRRFPGPSGASSSIAITIGETYTPSDLTDLDHWLSARWRLYSVMFGRLWGAHAVHEQWPLQHATLRQCDDGLVKAAGLPPAKSDPIVQFAERVTVRIGRPYRLGHR